MVVPYYFKRQPEVNHKTKAIWLQKVREVMRRLIVGAKEYSQVERDNLIEKA